MANFFSSAPIDLGADHISRGWSNVANSINRVADSRDERIKMTLANKMRMEEEERKRLENLSDKYRLAFKDKPLPMDAAGRPDAIAIMGALGEYDRTQAALAPYLAASGRNRADIESKSRALGQTGEPGKQPGSFITAAPGQKYNPGFGEQAQPDNRPMEQRVFEAENNLKRKAFEQDRNATADAQIRMNQEKESMAIKNIDAELAAEGIDPDGEAGRKKKAFRLRLNRMPSDAKYAMLTAQDSADNGLIPNTPDAIRREEMRLLQFGGKRPNLSATMEKSVVDESNLVMNLSGIQKAIAEFEQKHGVGSFDSYVGPIDSRTNEWKLNISKEAASPADNDAKRIAQMFQTTYNADLKATSGGAVTDSEAARKLVEAGSLNGANFKNSLQGWKEARVMGLKNKQRVLSDFAVPQGLFNFGDDEVASAPAAAAAQPAAGSAPPNPADGILKKYGL